MNSKVHETLALAIDQDTAITFGISEENINESLKSVIKFYVVEILLRAAHNQRNREQRIRISTYQKLCIPQYVVFDN